MRGKDLFEKFTNIKEEYIQEVETESERIANAGKKTSSNKIIALRKWATLAACIIALLVIIPVAGDLFIGLTESSSMDSATTTEGIPEDESVNDETVHDGVTEDSVAEGTLEDQDLVGEYLQENDMNSGAETESMEDSSGEFLAAYVDMKNFPIYDMEIERELVLEDRTVILETSIDNELEELVYDVFTDNGADDYLCTSTIHNMRVLTEEEVESFANTFALNLDAYVADENLEQTAIVLVDVTWEETHGEIGGGTYEYIPEGRYDKYFVLGKVEGSDMFEVLGVYLCE